MTATDLQPLTELQEQLLTALESGDYEQTTDQLFDANTNTYCCLGVACDLSDVGQWKGGEYVVVDTDGDDRYYDGHLPPEVVELFGLRSETGAVNLLGMLRPSEYSKTLTEMNDDAHFTFAQIADFIRNHPERVFNPSATDDT